MNNPCEKMRDKIADYVLGILNRNEIKALDIHINHCSLCKEYAESLKTQKQELLQFGENLDKQMADREAKAIEAISQVSYKKVKLPSIWKIIMKSKITKLATAAIIMIGVLGLFIVIGNGQKTLYAQVMTALEKANTCYVVGKQLRDGRWEKGIEAWYQHDAGVVEETWRDNKLLSKRIDNGQYMWLYRPGNDIVTRSESLDPVGIVADILDIRKITEKTIRDPGNDKVFNSERYFAYVSFNEEDTHQILIWLDEMKRLHEWEKRRVVNDSQWRTFRAGRVEYNIEVDSGIFAAEFGPDVKIVEVDKILDEYFSLDEVIFAREELGLVFAVHELKRCQDDLIYTVCSIRPTGLTRKKVKSSGTRVSDYGSFTIRNAWRSLDDYGRGRSFDPIGLARAYHAGLDVQWVLFLPKGFEPEGPKECEFEIYISTTGNLRKERTKDGLTIEQNFESMAILPLPEEQVVLQKVMDDTYYAIMELDLFAASTSLNSKLQYVPFTDDEMDTWAQEVPLSPTAKKWLSGDKSVRRSHKLPSSEIAKEDWIADQLTRLEMTKDGYQKFLEEVERRELNNN